jgi:hypothetical protein
MMKPFQPQKLSVHQVNSKPIWGWDGPHELFVAQSEFDLKEKKKALNQADVHKRAF